jgi:hypothetical protein
MFIVPLQSVDMCSIVVFSFLFIKVSKEKSEDHILQNVQYGLM